MRTLHRLILSLALIAGVAPAFAQVPPPVPALPDTERRTTYSITASLCTCGVGFQLYGDSTDVGNWLEVFVNGIRMTQSGNWNITSPTGSIATIARPITDAVLTFTAVQTGTVQIVGARRPRRASQFTTQPSARDFNQVLTDIIAQNRETWDKINDVTGRTVQAPPGETLALLPILASRASMGACFDSSGNLTSCLSVPSSSFAAGNGIALTGVNPTTISANIAAGAGMVVTPGTPTTVALGTFTQTGTGATAQNIISQLQQTVTPEQFGALCNGTGDDGPAIQRAINSVVGPVRVQLNSCTYRVVTPIVWTKAGVTIKGNGMGISGATIVDFEPTVDGILFYANGTGGQIYGTHISDVMIVSSNLTFKKTAIKIVDNSQCDFRNITIWSNTGYWQGGGTGGSLGFDTYGRDICTFENLSIYADFPIRLGLNPNFSFGTADHWVFRDLYLVANGNACITVGDVFLSNTTFEGRQAWARCTYGFAWVKSSASGGFPSVNVSFSNVRSEQSLLAASYTIFISQIAGNNLIGLKIENSDLDSSANGISLSGVKMANINGNYQLCGGGAPTALAIDTSDDQIALHNNLWGVGCVATLGGMLPMYSEPSPSGAVIPSTATYFSAASVATWLYRTIGTVPLAGASLPTCNAAATGARATLNNSTATLTAGIGGIIGFPGANIVPIFCDGTNWRVG